MTSRKVSSVSSESSVHVRGHPISVTEPGPRTPRGRRGSATPAVGDLNTAGVSEAPTDEPLIVAIDVGTTSVKAIVFDAQAHEHGSGDRGYPLHEPAFGQAEQDADEVIDATLQAARDAVQASGSDRIAGVSLSAAMHALVGLDGDGRPITPLVTWADSRAAEQAERLRSEHPSLPARTGTPLHPMAPLVKLVWFAEQQPELYARVARWVGIKELLIHRLTGEWLIDASCASGTGLMSSERVQWDDEALEVAGLRAEQLCPIVPTTHQLPLHASELGLSRGTPVVVGRRRRSAGQPRTRCRGPGRGRMFDRHQWCPAADRVPAGDRSRRPPVLLRPDP